jgi:hypothetical protein
MLTAFDFQYQLAVQAGLLFQSRQHGIDDKGRPNVRQKEGALIRFIEHD